MFANAVITVTVQWQTARDGQSNILISYDVGGISHIMKMGLLLQNMQQRVFKVLNDSVLLEL